MSLYSTLPTSLGYSSRRPRRSYRPASFYIDDDTSSVFALRELGYPSFRYTFPTRIDPETRYRQALYELQDAEQDFEAHMALERTRQVAILRQRAAAEAARRERALALHAEIERIEHARALQVQLEEYEQREAGLQAQAGLDRVARRPRGLFRSLVDSDIERDSTANCCSVESWHNHCQRMPAPARHSIETSTLGEIFKLFAGIEPEAQATTPLPTSSTPAPSQQQPPAEPQPPSKLNDAQVTFNDILEFFHGIAAHASGAENEHSPTYEVRFLVQELSTLSSNRYSQSSPRSEATLVERKDKGKAKAESVPEPSLLRTLLRERMQGGLSQELRDLERAIQLSLQERDAADAKKANVAKARSSSPGATSSKVDLLVLALSIANY
jgi:hypothetical protein